MALKPLVEINIELNNGAIDKWGLAIDDGCVVLLRTTGGEWAVCPHGYVPARVAMHMSSLAVIAAAEKQAHEIAQYYRGQHLEDHIVHPTMRPQ